MDKDSPDDSETETYRVPYGLYLWVSLLVLVNPLYTNGFFLLVQYNKLGIVHCISSGFLLFAKVLVYDVAFMHV